MIILQLFQKKILLSFQLDTSCGSAGYNLVILPYLLSITRLPDNPSEEKERVLTFIILLLLFYDKWQYRDEGAVFRSESPVASCELCAFKNHSLSSNYLLYEIAVGSNQVKYLNVFHLTEGITFTFPI